MKDKEFLCWIHERLKFVHNESHLSDYMHKLRAIIKATPEGRETPNIGTENDLYPEKRMAKAEQESGLRPCPLCGAVVRDLGYGISCQACGLWLGDGSAVFRMGGYVSVWNNRLEGKKND